jgi:hypothetical protein
MTKYTACLAFQMVWSHVKGVDVGNYDTTPITSYCGSTKSASFYGKLAIANHTYSYKGDIGTRFFYK